MKHSIVFFNKHAIVIGPTPPGTGVKAFATLETSSKLTSPTIPLSVLLIPTSITIVSRQTKSSAYSMKKVSFEENKTFNKSNVEIFINFHKKKLR